jgi:ArsR family transcriptional regulator
MNKRQKDRKAGVLSALAHPNRIRILEYIQCSVKCNCEIAPALDLEQSNLSRHLKILVEEGILTSWKEGLRVNYSVTDERIFDIIGLAQSVAGQETKTRFTTRELA